MLVGNFNNSTDPQGTGSTIINYRPDTKQMPVFAMVPRDLKECPGGIGLSTAMTCAGLSVFSAGRAGADHGGWEGDSLFAGRKHPPPIRYAAAPRAGAGVRIDRSCTICAAR
jgi:hypothetical protein